MLEEISFRERFNTLIGLTFLLVVLFSPNGLIGIGQRLAGSWSRRRSGAGPSAERRTGRGPAPEAEPANPPLADPASER